MQLRQLATFAAGASAALALVVACGAFPIVGAQEPSADTFIVEAQCDRVMEYRNKEGSIVIKRYFAEIAPPAGSIPIAALGCEILCGPDACTSDLCPSPYECNGYVPPFEECTPLTFKVIPGPLTVVTCGGESLGVNAPLGNYQRVQTVKVVYARPD